MNRTHQILLIAGTLYLSWLGMMVIHEAGHVLGAWASGGRVSEVILHPLRFSETVLSDNPHALAVVWMGPLIGVVLPLLAWLTARHIKFSWAYLLRFFAGFCLLANGAYIGIGSFSQIADAGDLLDLGAPIWQLWLFGVLCIPIAFLLFNHQGPHFGLGDAKGRVNHIHVYAVLTLLVALILIETLLMLA